MIRLLVCGALLKEDQRDQFDDVLMNTLESEPDIRLVGRTYNVREATDLARIVCPSVVVLRSNKTDDPSEVRKFIAGCKCPSIISTWCGDNFSAELARQFRIECVVDGALVGIQLSKAIRHAAGCVR